MSAKPWFAWYPADYRAKTTHLTFIEDAAYRRLLEAYYERRGPLPANLEGLYRMVASQTSEEREAVRKIAAEFFVDKGGFLHHERCDAELVKQADFIAEQSRKGKLSAQARYSNRGSTVVQPVGQPESNLPHPQSHITATPTTTTKKSKPLASSEKDSLLAGDPANGVEYIPIVGGAQWGVGKDFLAELERAYPAVDGAATLREIRAWCVSNP
ncbi:MAG: YdaU family protein, partial [Gallionella sp.]|nr:YdaU family protein [Gallionella sp.]